MFQIYTRKVWLNCVSNICGGILCVSNIRNRYKYSFTVRQKLAYAEGLARLFVKYMRKVRLSCSSNIRGKFS